MEILKIFLFIVFLSLPIILCVAESNEAKFKKNIAVGVTIPKEGQDDPEIQARLKRFRSQMVLITVLLIIVLIPSLFLNYLASICYDIFWTDAVLVICALPYIACNTELKRIKSQRGWYFAASAVTVDTACIPEQKTYAPWYFLVPAVASLLPLLWDREIWYICVLFAALAAAFWPAYRYLYRNRSETVNEDTALTDALTRIRRQNWARMWILGAWSMVPISFATSLVMISPFWTIVIVMADAVFITAAGLVIEFSTRRAQEKLTENAGGTDLVDEDDYWIWGIFYCNPNDSSLMVNNRIGLNSTVNLARPAGKAIMIALAALMVALPLWMTAEFGFSDNRITLSLTATAVTAQEGRTEYTIPLDDIAETEILEELPDGLYRVYGTGLDDLLKGRFKCDAYGNMKVMCNPQCPPFLLIRTEEGDVYLFGGETEGEIEALAAEITAAIE